MTRTLEVCVDDAWGLHAACAGGADRIELCSALSVGGLTPSAGLMALAATLHIPSYAMIRPRAGDFVFRPEEIDIILCDIDASRRAGLAGVVLGASLPDGSLDMNILKRLIDRASGLGLTLHRAFDLVPDQEQALEQAIDLGFERILTSGGARSAPAGREALVRLATCARGRISIMPGSGIAPANIADLLDGLAVSEVHASCSRVETAQDQRLVALGFLPASYRRTDEQTVRALKAML